jgi:transcriptional regulator with XRE-family HTH domain
VYRFEEERKVEGDSDEMRLLVRFLRALHGGSQKALARAAGVDRGSICTYELGRTTPSRPILKRLAGAAGLTLAFVEAEILPAIRLALAVAGRPAGGKPPADEEAEEVFAQALYRAARGTVGAFLAELEAADAAGTPAGREERVVAELWARLASGTAAQRRRLIKRSREFHRWDLSERLCEESARAAAHDAAEALELARLGLRVAELAPGSAGWRSRLRGYVWAFVGNALRVGSDLPGAEAAFVRAWKLWSEGAGSDPGRLAEWRLLDLEASLRRGRRQWREALALLDRARSVAPPAAVGRIVLKRAFTLEQAGDAQAALATLREAAPLVEGADDPRLPWAVRFNLIALLCHLGRHAEAEDALGEVRKLAEKLGNRLDLIRVRWLEGRVAAGLGRKKEGRAAFMQARQEFTALANGYDTALVSLELAVLELEEGRTEAVRGLAGEMLWIFSAQGVHREALAALRLFCEAAEAESATPTLARRVVAYLEQARHDPSLRFEATAGG